MNMDYEKIKAAAAGYQADMTRFLRAMISHPSESCEEKEVVACIKAEMEKLGYDAVEVDGLSLIHICDVSEMTYDYLTSEAFRKEFGQATFFTATDGNHGRGVAWACLLYTSELDSERVPRPGLRVRRVQAGAPRRREGPAHL